MVTRAIIAAAGSEERWGNHLGVPKQLIPIDGETLLDRIIRLLHREGIRDIVISGAFRVEGCRTVIPEWDIDPVDGRLGVRGLWNDAGRTIILMGDVWYSDAAMQTIGSHVWRDRHLFARFGPSKRTGKPWAEIFANSFWPEHHADHEASLRAVNALHEAGHIPRGGLWESYLLDHGAVVTGMMDADGGCVRNMGDATVIDDMTDDFDYPADYDRWVSARG